MVVTANFVPDDEPPPPAAYTLTVSASPSTGGNSVSRAPSQTSYAAGTQVVIAATAGADYTFSGWTGAVTSASASVTVKVDSNMTVTANFTLKPVAVEQYCRWEGNTAHATCVPIEPNEPEAIRTAKQCTDKDGEVVTACDAPSDGVWCDWGAIEFTATGRSRGCWWHNKGSADCEKAGKVVTQCRDDRLISGENEAWVDMGYAPGSRNGVILNADGSVIHIDDWPSGTAWTQLGTGFWNISGTTLSITREEMDVDDALAYAGNYGFSLSNSNNTLTLRLGTSSEPLTRTTVTAIQQAAPPGLSKKAAKARASSALKKALKGKR
jgi:uncharacterized repeat protein (TIGR02543 family)